MGARRIVFDIDFSAASTPQNDQAFADALRRALGKVWLAEFEHPAGEVDRSIVNAPIPLLTQYAHTVSIDVPVAPDGVVRQYDIAHVIGGGPAPTVAALLSDRSDVAPGRFGVDYGLDFEGAPRLSAADVLAGRAPRSLLAGRDVIIGASAEELRDFFLTPRGVLPGVAVHAFAAETLRMRRELQPTPTSTVVSLILLLAVVASLIERRMSPVGTTAALALSGFGVEAAALGLHKWAALTTPTAGVHAALAVFALGALVSALQLRRRMHAEAARERDRARAMLNQVIADNFDGVVVIGGDGRILEASRPAHDLVGRALRDLSLDALPEELAQAVSTSLAAPGRVERIGEARLQAPNGAVRYLDYVVTVSNVPEAPQHRVACLTFRDVTERRAHLARLSYLARHDEMTGAFTRGEFLALLRRRLAADSAGVTVCCLALRRFDLANDVFGHRAGDRLLAMVVERLYDLGLSDVARLGGARFAFVVAGVEDSPTLAAHGAKIIGRIAEPYRVDGQQVIVGASLGATTTAISGADVETLLTHAKMAQASAARRIGDVFEPFSPELESRRREKLALDADLRQAIADNALVMHFQSKVNLAGGRVIGAEALMRWRKDGGVFVPPSAFISVAEESGLIVDLGRHALRHACAEAARWPKTSVVAVNVSPVQFSLSDVFADVSDALAGAGLAPERLEIEITESAIVDGAAPVATALAKLRAIGVKIALDDFGTGYSSLHYLGRLPIDTIKIDQSFVRDMRGNRAAASTVRAIVALAKAHGKEIVAEGVETAEDAAELQAMGCEFGQGHFFGKAIDAAAFAAAIRLGRAAA
jgi:diguanylate cyclase (GGDEF)-like protein